METVCLRLAEDDTHQPEHSYQCRGNSPEEVYCCQAGESITRDTALVHSCGLYFAPQRLHIGADIIGGDTGDSSAPAWLASLTTLKPEAGNVNHCLIHHDVIAQETNFRKSYWMWCWTRRKSELHPCSVTGQTWSWFADDHQEIRQGGFARWLTDNTLSVVAPAKRY